MKRAFAQCDSEDEAEDPLLPGGERREASACIIKHPRDGLRRGAAPGLMFMLHHKSDFHRVFAVHGGLEGLASRLQEEDQHVRARAVEIFLRVTGDEALKWYVAPSTDDEVKMHRSLLDLGIG